MNYLLIFLLLFSVHLHAQEHLQEQAPDVQEQVQETENYCLNPEYTKSNEELLARNPNNPSIQMIYALRLGICKMIEDGLISVEQGIDIFEEQREEEINKHIEREKEVIESLKESAFAYNLTTHP